MSFEVKNYQDLNKEQRELFRSSLIGLSESNHFMRNGHAMAYFQEYHGPSFENRSVILYRNATPVMMIPAFCKKGELNFAGQATNIVSFLDLDYRYKLTRTFLKMLKKHFTGSNVVALLVSEPILLQAAFASVKKLLPAYIASVNLELQDATLFNNIRKSYKPLLNWGSRSLDTKIIDYSNIDYAEFEEFKNLHFKSSGRKTRSDVSWDLQFELIKKDKAFLVSAKLNSDLVSGCYIMHDEKTAFYGVAASDRDLMSDKHALNHYPLYVGIKTAKEKGCKKFLLGDVTHTAELKSSSIAFFKIGFATDIEIEEHMTVVFGGND